MNSLIRMPKITEIAQRLLAENSIWKTEATLKLLA